MQQDPYYDNAAELYLGTDINSRKRETLHRQRDEIRHRMNSAELNFGAKTPKWISYPDEPLKGDGISDIDNDRLIKQIINIVLPNTENPHLQPRGIEAREAEDAKYYGAKSFI